MTLAWRQSWVPLHAVVAFTPVSLLGIELSTVAGCAALSKLWQAVVHTSLPVTAPRWVAAIVMTPATHRRHHTLDGGDTNLGPVLTIWDRMAGTWDPTPAPADARFGLHATPDRRGGPAHRAWRIETDGWILLARRRLRNHPARRATAGYG